MPPVNAKENFEAAWNLINENYGHFPVKNINWDSVKSVYASQTGAIKNNDELFDFISKMLSTLKDGHLTLSNSLRSYVYDFTEGANANFISVEAIASQITSYRNNNVVGYGKTPDNIGYIFISQWNSSNPNDFNLIETAVQDFSTTKGLIIDVRNNAGGNAQYAENAASIFFNSSTLTSYVRLRNSGTDRNSFTDYMSNNTVPHPSLYYNKPVIILTNRKCYSSNEHFIHVMKCLPNVKIYGDTTGGGSANAIEKLLPNGWKLQIPRWIEYDRNKKHFEGIGLFPDSTIHLSATDIANRDDKILKAAINKLK